VRLYLAILEGPSPKQATPILASDDPDLIRSFGEVLAGRLGIDQPAISRLPDANRSSPSWARGDGSDA
jgi:hypothetical protein